MEKTASVLETKSQKTRRRIIGYATQLVHRQGLKNTTIDEIVNAAGITKGSFYFHFASKEELGYAVIDSASAYVLGGLEQLAQDASLAPAQRLEAMLELIRRAVEENNCESGCILGNLALEMSDLHAGYRRRLSEVFDTWAGLFRGPLEEMQQTGELGPELDVADFARHALVVLEGGIMLAKVKRDPAPLQAETKRLLGELEKYRTAGTHRKKED